MTPDQLKRRLLLAGLVIVGLVIVGRLGYFFLIDRPNEFTDCLLDHRKGYHLLTPREPIHEACRKRLDPRYR